VIDRELESFFSDNGMAADNSPVTDEELELAHDMIRDRLSTRFATFRRAFRMLDADGSGKCERNECLRMLMLLNLSNIRQAVMVKLAEICDANGDGVGYDEFCDLLMAEDALPLLEKRHRHSGM